MLSHFPRDQTTRHEIRTHALHDESKGRNHWATDSCMINLLFQHFQHGLKTKIRGALFVQVEIFLLKK